MLYYYILYIILVLNIYDMFNTRILFCVLRTCLLCVFVACTDMDVGIMMIQLSCWYCTTLRPGWLCWSFWVKFNDMSRWQWSLKDNANFSVNGEVMIPGLEPYPLSKQGEWSLHWWGGDQCCVVRMRFVQAQYDRV